MSHKVFMIALVLLLASCSRMRSSLPAKHSLEITPVPETPQPQIKANTPTMSIPTATADSNNSLHPTMSMQAMDTPMPTMEGMPDMAEPDTIMTSPMADDPMHAGPHMLMAASPTPSSEDRQRAEEFSQAARLALSKYADYKVALQDGYRVLAPEVSQDVYHFINLQEAMSNFSTFEPTRPTALLYKKTVGGYQWVGAMYSAPASSSEEQLNQRFPLSMAQWHAHVNICVPPGKLDLDRLVADPKFGFEGSLATREACQAAGGRFLENPFGWMVHVYFSAQ